LILLPELNKMDSFNERSPSMRLPALVLIILCLLVVAGIVYMFSGWYDISATQPHWDASVWMINQVRNHSIEFHSKGIKPHDLKDEKLLKVGIKHYHEMCRLCHGASGQEKRSLPKVFIRYRPNWNQGGSRR